MGKQFFFEQQISKKSVLKKIVSLKITKITNCLKAYIYDLELFLFLLLTAPKNIYFYKIYDFFTTKSCKAAPVMS